MTKRTLMETLVAEVKCRSEIEAALFDLRIKHGVLPSFKYIMDEWEGTVTPALVEKCHEAIRSVCARWDLNPQDVGYLMEI
jgi:hypothetical protein